VIYRVTEQDTRVVEHSYDVEGHNIDDAQDAFEAMSAEEKAPLLVHEETTLTNCEVTAIEEVSR
jgi:hypothetical protein